MSTIDSPNTSSNNLEAFPSFALQQVANTELLKRYHEGRELKDNLIADVETFIQRGIITGALLDAEEDRWASQSQLDYWATTLVRAGHTMPDATLADFDLSLAPELSDDQCPYLGLDAFHEDNRRIFFGRQALVNQALEKLQESQVLAIVGPSGSGKSSLVRAGIVPVLKINSESQQEHRHYFPTMVPGSDPLDNLARIIFDSGDEREIEAQAREFLNDSNHLTKIVANTVGGSATFVVDQFEEIFTLCSDQAKRLAFVDNLLKLIQAPDARHIVILTMRSDFEPNIARLPDFQPMFKQGQLYITPLSASEMRDAITEPAKQVGLKIEKAVVDALIDDILGEPAALPLLQFTLLKLWETRDRNRVMWDAYQRLGGGRRALERSADEFYENLIEEDRTVCKRILLRMVRPAADGLEITSNRIQRDLLYKGGEADYRIKGVVDRLIKAHLIRITEGSKPEDMQIEVAHEALIRNWPQLVYWLEDEREEIRQRLRLTDAAAQWDSLGRDPGALLQGALLDQALTYTELSEREKVFIEASKEAIDRTRVEKEDAIKRELENERALTEEQRQRVKEQTRATKLLLIFVVFLAIFAVAAVSAAGFAVSLGQQASASAATAQALQVESETRLQGIKVAQSKLLSARSGEALNDFHYQTALVFGLESYYLNPNPNNADAHQALIGALTSPVLERIHAIVPEPILDAVLAGDTSSIVSAKGGDNILYLRTLNDQSDPFPLDTGSVVKSASLSPDGKYLLSRSVKNNVNTATLWSLSPLTSPSQIREMSAVTGAAWSPDSRHILIWLDDGTAQIESLDNSNKPTELNSLGKVTGATWSPDGQQFTVWSSAAEAAISVWSFNASSRPSQLGKMSTPTPVTGATWEADGKNLIYWLHKGAAYLWSTERLPENPDKESVLILENSVVRGLAWNPDLQKKRQFLYWSDDDMIHILSLDHLNGDQQVLRHDGPVRGVRWSRDGQEIVSWADDETVRVWALNGPVNPVDLPHNRFVRGAIWSRDNQQILSWSGDGTLRIWSANPQNEYVLLKTFAHDDVVLGATWNTTENRILSWSDDGYVRIWDAGDSSTPLFKLKQDGNDLHAAWSPNEKKILVWSLINQLQVWTPEDANPDASLPLDTSGSVNNPVWSKDGSKILAASNDGITRIWNLNDPDPNAHPTLFRNDDNSYVKGAIWSPDEQKIVTWSADNDVRLWSTDNPSTPLRVWHHDDSIEGAKWSNDNQRVLTWSADKTIRIWSVDNSVALQTFRHDGPVKGVMWSSDERQILSWSDDNTVRIWSVDNSNALQIFRHDGPVLGATWGINEKQILSWSDDDTARIWSLDNPLTPLILRHDGPVAGTQWNVNEQKILTWLDDQNDHFARIWSIDLTTLVGVSECYRHRFLSADERTSLGLTEEETTPRSDCLVAGS